MARSWVMEVTAFCILLLALIPDKGEAVVGVSIAVRHIRDGKPRVVDVASGSVEIADPRTRVQLVCKVAQGGDPSRLVRWTHRGRPVESSLGNPAWAEGTQFTDYVLTISNVSSSNGGRYECSTGAQRSSFTLHVRAILRPVSKRRLVIVGHRVDIECAASGYPTPRVQWRKIGQNKNHFRRVEGRGAVNLTINSLIPADGGKYGCSIVHPTQWMQDTDLTLLIKRQGQQQGSRESLSMLLKENVKGGELIPFQKGETKVRARGSSFDLDCHLEPGGDPTVSVSWWVNGRRFRNKSRAKIIGWLPGEWYQDHQIRFFNYTSHDGGVYSCVTSAGNVSATLAVEPVISEITRRMTVKTGDPVVLHCKAAGYPRPSVFWKHLPSGTLTQSRTVNLTAAEAKDGGQYECTAHNEHGQKKSRTKVTISDPRFSFAVEDAQHRMQQRITVGDTASFSCAIKGHTGLPVAWFFSSQASLEQLSIKEAQLKYTNSTLVIGSFAASDVGKYTCVVGSVGEQLQRSFVASLKPAEPQEPFLVPECAPGSLDCSASSMLLSNLFLVIASILAYTLTMP